MRREFILGIAILAAGCVKRTFGDATVADDQIDKSLPMIALDQSIFNPVPFQSQKSFLAMNVDGTAIKTLYNSLQGTLTTTFKLSNPLLTTGEAHITVVDATEYKNTLQKRLSMQDMETLTASTLQQAEFTPVCLGKGQATLDGQNQQTYFIVVTSADLIKVREEIQNAYISNGGSADDFNPQDFYPHITVGYTDRDLFQQDGVIKDARSCIANVSVN